MSSPMVSPAFFALERYSLAFLLNSSWFAFQLVAPVLVVLVLAGVAVGVAVARLALVFAFVLALSLPLHAAAAQSASPASSASIVFLFIPSPVILFDPLTQRTRARTVQGRAYGGPLRRQGVCVWFKARAILTPRVRAGQGEKRPEVGGRRSVIEY